MDKNSIKIKKIQGIDDAPGEYFVSESGEIFKKLKPWRSSNGYLDFKFGKNGKHKRVHRIVAETFIPNPDNLPEVNHKDRNIYNNDVSNLEWVTRKENMNHMYATGSSPVRNHTWCELYKNGKFIKEFKTIKEACIYASENYKVSAQSLQKHRKASKDNINIELKVLKEQEEKCND